MYDQPLSNFVYHSLDLLRIEPTITRPSKLIEHSESRNRLKEAICWLICWEDEGTCIGATDTCHKRYPQSDIEEAIICGLAWWNSVDVLQLPLSDKRESPRDERCKILLSNAACDLPLPT